MPGLDGLRGLAVLAVVAYHLGLPGARGGFLGVDVFFVVSGFLVTTLLAGELTASGRIDVLGFWQRRVRRLMPALLTLIVVVGAVYGFRLPEKLSSGRLDLLAGALYASNWRMILTSTSYFDQIGRPPLTRHLWSLAIEGQFYIAWPVVMIALAYACGTDRRRMASITALLGVISLAWGAVLYHPGTDPSRVYFGTDTRLVAVLAGAALALALPVGPKLLAPARAKLSMGGVLGLFVLAGCVGLVTDQMRVLYGGGFGLVAAVTAVVVWAAAVPKTVVATTLAWRPFVWIGVRSYSLYLWHWPVIALTQPGVDVAISTNRWLLAAARFAGSLALTELSFRLIEEPFRKKLFGRWLASITGRQGAILRTPRWYAGTLGAALLLVGGAAGVSRAAQNDGIADSLRAPNDEVLVSHNGRSGTALGTTPAPAFPVSVAVANMAAPTTFPPAPPDPQTPPPTTDPTHPGVTVAPTLPTTTLPRPPSVLAIGDSIMKGAAPSLSTRLGDGSVIDTAISRPFTAGVKVLDQQLAKGRAFGAIVIHLGNNGVPSRKQFSALMTKIDPATPVLFITMRESREWAPKLNALLREEATNYVNIRILEWNEAAGDRSYLFAKDKLHLTGTGGRYYSDLVVWGLQQAGYRGVPTPTTSTSSVVASTTTSTLPGTVVAANTVAPTAPPTTTRPPNPSTTIVAIPTTVPPPPPSSTEVPSSTVPPTTPAG